MTTPSTPPAAATAANDRQVGGGHYKSQAVQPWDFIARNGIGYLEGCAIKYLSRWRSKGGVDDLRKAVHFVEKLIELETPPAPEPPNEPVQEGAAVPDAELTDYAEARRRFLASGHYAHHWQYDAKFSNDCGISSWYFKRQFPLAASAFEAGRR